MKSLTGGRDRGEYEPIHHSNTSGTPGAHDSDNPFTSSQENGFGSSDASTSSKASSAALSDSMLGEATVASSNSGSGTRLSVNGAAPYPPSAMSGPDFDRYPMRKSLMPPSVKGTRYSHSSYDDGRTASLTSSVNEENDPFLAASVNADFSPFGGYPATDFPLHMDEKEADDYLHNPDPIADAIADRRCHRLDRRGWGCLIAFILLIAGSIIVFILLPILDFTGPTERSPAPNQGASLSPYSYSHLKALRPLIDTDTPESAKTHTSLNGKTWDLVFSDEFNVEGRTFYPGDDTFWEAANFHYQATQDLEWYDPDAVTTANGSLILKLDAYTNHNLLYRSGMLQSWNKLCFRQGYIEIGALLPGSGTILGFWPGLWTLGNLARPGYLATSEGVWPYSYFDCDVGITPNQSAPDGISYLPGQRLSSCVCSGEDHPTPGKGRGAPEIDIIEGSVSNTPNTEYPIWSMASQSLQIAPMDIWYMVDYDFIAIYNTTISKMNSWTGGPLQQAASAYTYLGDDWYEYVSSPKVPNYHSFGVEYLNDEFNDGKDGYISWYVAGTPAYTMYNAALSPNGNIGQRQISREPMSVVMNLAISSSWTYIDWLDLTFPAHLRVDYVRIYQDSNMTSLTCDPEGWETTQYISDHPKAYLNVNATSWEKAGYKRPKNKLMDGCST